MTASTCSSWVQVKTVDGVRSIVGNVWTGSGVVDLDAIDANHELLVALLASFPDHTPSVVTLVGGLELLDQESGWALSGEHRGQRKARVTWYKQESSSLRAMLAHVRKLARKNGPKARSPPQLAPRS